MDYGRQTVEAAAWAMNVVGGDGDEAAQTGTLQNGFYAVTTFNLTAPDHPESGAFYLKP
jgi:hypothetical protein